MPTYEYMCPSCGGRFDRFQSITAAPVRECPDCGSNVKRLISGGSGFIMKGSSKEMPACAGPGSCCAQDSCAMAEHCH